MHELDIRQFPTLTRDMLANISSLFHFTSVVASPEQTETLVDSKAIIQGENGHAFVRFNLDAIDEIELIPVVVA